MGTMFSVRVGTRILGSSAKLMTRRKVPRWTKKDIPVEDWTRCVTVDQISCCLHQMLIRSATTTDVAGTR